MLKGSSKHSILSFNANGTGTLSLQMEFVGVNMPATKEVLDSFAEGKDVESLGWFGGSNNANTFYAGLDVPKEIMPKPEDFIKVPFRLLSATTVGAGSWKSTDFSNEKVLKASLKKLVGKPLYYDHDTDLLNWVGIVESVKWTEARMQDGQLIPAGIDGIVAIDAKTNPKIARGVLVGSIFSNSVTVSFDWEPSHKFENEYDFYNRIGTMSTVDNTMIRRVVTEIFDYYESSLVWLGADPFAKAIDEKGNLKHVDSTAVYIPYSKEDKEVIDFEANKRYKASCLDEKLLLSLSRKTTLNSNSSKPSNTMKDLITLFKTALNIEETALKGFLGLKQEEEVTASHLTSFFTKQPSVVEKEVEKLTVPTSLLNNSTATQALGAITPETDFSQVTIIKNEDFAKLNESVEKLTKEGLELSANAKVGVEFLNLKRNEVKRLYKAQVGTPDEAVLKLMDEASTEALDGLLKLHTKGVTEKFGGHCKKCGSHEFSFQSSYTGPEAKKVEVKVSSFDEMYNKFDNQSMDLKPKK